MRSKLQAKIFFLCVLAVAVVAVLGTALVSAETGAMTETLSEPVAAEGAAEAPETLLCPASTDSALLATAGKCLHNEDCKDDCPTGGRCDAGSCLCTGGELELTVIGECESDDECDCPNGGRCEKYHCLCYGL